MGKDDIILVGSSLITLTAIGISLVMVNQLAGEIADIGERSVRDLKEFKELADDAWSIMAKEVNEKASFSEKEEFEQIIRRTKRQYYTGPYQQQQTYGQQQFVQQQQWSQYGRSAGGYAQPHAPVSPPRMVQPAPTVPRPGPTYLPTRPMPVHVPAPSTGVNQGNIGVGSIPRPSVGGTCSEDGIPGKDGAHSSTNYGPGIEIGSGGCVKCPSGPPGPPGVDGMEGPPGMSGLNGGSSGGMGYGMPGPPGPPGDPGSAGRPGMPGSAGIPGAPGGGSGSRRGAPGPPGPSGPAGAPGMPGNPAYGGGASGMPGPPGRAGRPGPAGSPGLEGGFGSGGGPGGDGAYCPCPKRNTRDLKTLDGDSGPRGIMKIRDGPNVPRVEGSVGVGSSQRRKPVWKTSNQSFMERSGRIPMTNAQRSITESEMRAWKRELLRRQNLIRG